MSFLKERTVQESIEIIGRVIQVISSKGPLCKELSQLFEQGLYLQIIDYPFDYLSTCDVDDLVYARQIQGFVAKQDFLDLGIDKERVAYDTFLEAESSCRLANDRFENLSSFSKDVSAVFHYTTRKIAEILGSVPSVDSLDLSFGPGATTSTKSVEANARVKLSSNLECSSNLIPLVGHVLAALPQLLELHNQNHADDSHSKVNVTLASGKLAFVPKNCRTHRAIVVEPILNGLVQKGIGNHIKRRLLLRAGIDLSDQTRNQRAAYKGSLDGLTATVDLKSASDTISRGAVWSLLPYDWASFLDSCRSETVTYRGETIVLEKFSSMGNAYTFELESLIFYSLAVSTCHYLQLDSKEVCVFGDDIIIPVPAMSLFGEVLNAAGFEVNTKKSFASGPFRESCGADYFMGFDIRPFYLKDKISERVLFIMHNWFIRHCEFALAKAVLSEVRQDVALYGPDGYGDGHLIGHYQLRSSRKRQRAGYDGGVFDTYTLKPRHYRKVLPGDWIFPCYSIYVRGTGHHSIFDESASSDPDVVRGNRGYTKISIYTLVRTIFYPTTIDSRLHSIV
jgi:hypothetical protein